MDIDKRFRHPWMRIVPLPAASSTIKTIATAAKIPKTWNCRDCPHQQARRQCFYPLSWRWDLKFIGEWRIMMVCSLINLWKWCHFFFFTMNIDEYRCYVIDEYLNVTHNNAQLLNWNNKSHPWIWLGSELQTPSSLMTWKWTFGCLRETRPKRSPLCLVLKAAHRTN